MSAVVRDPIRRVAVIAHTGKTFGGGLPELRRLLDAEPIKSLRWYEVPKSRKAPKKIAKALRRRPDLIIVWGGDGMVQRCVDALVGHDVPAAIMPAGTANLLAHNLGVPAELPDAFQVAMRGRPRRIDLGRINGEHFAVMAGIGFDADMIAAADGAMKNRLGRLAYVWTGARNLGAEPARMTVKVDGSTWFDGTATCVLVGNVPKVFGEVEVFDDAVVDDGRLDVGVTTATGAVQWARTLAGIGAGRSEDASHVEMVRARRISVKLAAPLRYELDGGARGTVRKLKVRVVPGAVRICVPNSYRTELS